MFTLSVMRQRTGTIWINLTLSTELIYSECNVWHRSLSLRNRITRWESHMRNGKRHTRQCQNARQYSKCTITFSETKFRKSIFSLWQRYRIKKTCLFTNKDISQAFKQKDSRHYGRIEVLNNLICHGDSCYRFIE